jgi:CshA-type fibril repeat protein
VLANQAAPNCNATSLTTADGVYTVNPTTGVVTFNPDADFTGVATEPVTYQVADADGQIVSAVITPSVVGLPTAAPDTSTGAFNEPQSKTVLTNDQSLTGTPLSASTLKLRNPSNGTFGTAPVTIANEGTYSISGSSIVFTPVTNYSGTATPVTYQVTDSMGQSVSTTYTPTVTAPAGLNADPETSVGTKNNPQTVDLLEGDSTSSNSINFVPASIVLSCTVSTNCTVANNIVTVANVGSYALDPQHPGFVIFTPVFNYVGSAPSVTYTVTDTLGRTVSETYSPTVLEGPVVSPDYSRGPADAPQSKNVLENDNVQGANLLPETLQLRHPTTQQLLAEPTVTLAGEGTFAFSGNTITFTPAEDFVETILADRTRLVEVYQVDDNGAFVLDDNGDRIVIGLEATVPPIMYQLKDVNGRVVTASYTPRVYFPNPVAAPDYSRGPADAPQRQQVLGNDAATGTRLIPSTLKLIDPATNQPVNSPTVPVAGEGTFRFEGDTITFTPDLDALVETLRLDLVAHGNTYQNSRLHAVYENGVYMGLEADITPISYKLQDEFGRWVTTTYYPKVFFPKPAAAPDVTRGAINQPQSKAIIMNDDPSTGVVFDNTYLKIWDYDTRAWVTSPVVTRDGTYTVEAADGVVLAAGLGGNKQILASSLNAAGAYNLIVFTPVNNFVGRAIPIPYQIRDIFGQYVESTYTPTIETDVVASVAGLVRTGMGDFGGLIQATAALLLVAAGIVALRKRRQEEI